ncbi:o-succinylbenzoate--CoA ligase [Natronobacterium texcoconense]|uniref:o-succinylbenzoate--CoA ligase n=1 Tax=Natronobacterium texcoconense TaxID=1095778 RepID=UPI000B81B720|nr:o-succinylbenzoate--CoA ligase [Natronobacterium texcoconense]
MAGVIPGLEASPPDLLASRAAATPETTAMIDVETGHEWTYTEFDERVAAVARAFAPDSSRIGILMDTRPAFAVVFFAAMRTGTTVVPLNVRETTETLAGKVERTGCETIVCERETEGTALEISDRTNAGPVVSVDEPEAGTVEYLSDRTEDGVSSASDREIDPDDTQLIMFTSGTSGEPKGVRLTVGNLLASATASAFRLGVDPDDRWLCCLPMYHMGGLAPVLRSTLYGTTVVIQREFDPLETARVLEEYDVTGVSLVPTMCKRLLEAGWEPADSLRFVLLGGAPATEDLLERCLEAGVPVHPTYGMTETASQIATATPEEIRSHEGTVGRPLVGTEVTVVDDDGERVPPGEPGELVVSGPTVTPGYLEDEQTAAAIGERGLHTGDIGYRDEGGRLWILNRRSDRIVTGGENVDPGEVIDALRSHPDVDDASVVGLPDEEWGERVAAAVVPAGDGLEYASVFEHCDERLAGFKRPKTLAAVDELPRTASGTVDREGVRERLLEDGVGVSDARR